MVRIASAVAGRAIAAKPARALLWSRGVRFVMSSEYASPARTETSLAIRVLKKLEIPRLHSE